MASASSKIATDSQGKPSIQANNLPPDEDDDENIDLGAASPSQTSLKDSKQGFEMINLDADEEDEYDFESSLPDKRRKRYRKKKKKKEELCDSSSDDESTKSRSTNEEVNPSDLTWPLYLWYYIVAVSTGALRAAEYLGEKLAYFFGITSPKYQYVIDEYYRQKELEKEEEDREEREREYVARMEAERIASLEGGDNAQATLTIPDDPSIQSPTKT